MAEYSDISVSSSPMAELTVASTPMDDHSTDAITVPAEITELTSSDEIAQRLGVNLSSEEARGGTSRIQFRRRIKPMAWCRGLMCAPKLGSEGLLKFGPFLWATRLSRDPLYGLLVKIKIKTV
jgi:hypothetical protein